MCEKERRLEWMEEELLRQYELVFGETCKVNDIVYVEAVEKEVKVDNFGFDLRIPNGHIGKGTICNPVVIFEPGFILDKCPIKLTEFRIMQGKIDIYESDCGPGSNTVAKTLQGKYTIYYKDGVVFFAKWKEE